MEHVHIEVVKNPTLRTNNQNYNSQICHYLNCAEKCWQFNTAVALCLIEPSTKTDDGFPADSDSDSDLDSDSEACNNNIEAKKDVSNVLNDIWASKCQSTNYFHVAVNSNIPSSPPHTFITSVSMAIHLNMKYSIRAFVDVITETFGLSDLQAALGDYLVCNDMFGQNFHSFGAHPATLIFHLKISEFDLKSMYNKGIFTTLCTLH